MVNSINKWKGIWFAALFALLLFGLVVLSQPAFADIASGTCGTCSWIIDDAGSEYYVSGND